MSEQGDAREALDQAAAVASQMRARGRWHVPLILLLGALMAGLVLAAGMLLTAPNQGLAFALALLPLLGLVIYTASQPVIPRYHKQMYALVTPLGALIYTVTVVFGAVFFPKALAWWLPGAAGCTLPFLLAAVLNVRSRRETGSGLR
jgi:hypothetical protein